MAPPRSHQPETDVRVVHANGLDHAVFDQGQGPLILLQHGFPDTAHTWDLLVPDLVAAGYRVVCPFGRGIAPSALAPGDAYRVQDLAADLVALIDALGASTATLVGHDWGAAAVWGAAYLAPEKIERVAVLAIPHPLAVKPTAAKIWGARHFATFKLPGAARRFAADDFAEVRALYERWSPGFDWPDSEFEAVKNAYAAPGCLDAALGYYRRLGLWPFRGKVSMPVLVLGGQTDGVATAADFERAPRFVDADCTVKMLPGGHFLHREHPEPVRDALLDFLARPGASGRLSRP